MKIPAMLRLIRSPLRRISIWRILRGGRVKDKGRLPRYSGVAMIGLAVIWTLALAYIFLAPKSYTSGFTFILPGAGASASISLDEIGQASASASSPYASSSLSPTENYKKLLGTERVKANAGARVGMSASEFPNPKIKLVTQTNLMFVSLKAGSPQAAKDRADALHAAFLEELDKLRADEITERDTAYREALAKYKEGVKASRRRILDHQASTGLVSEGQYNDMVKEVDNIAIALRKRQAELNRTKSELAALEDVLGITSELAAIALKLQSDKAFQHLNGAYGEAAAALAAVSRRLGPAHPRRQALQAAHDSARAALVKAALTLTSLPEEMLEITVDLSASESRAELLTRVVSLSGEAAGQQAELEVLQAQKDRAERRLQDMLDNASVLDDLNRDHRVAEAVFSSALARIDTSKTDFFASYPLVQTLERPAKPSRPTSPNPVIGFAAAFAGSLCLMIGLAMAWVRKPIIDRLLPPGVTPPPGGPGSGLDPKIAPFGGAASATFGAGGLALGPQPGDVPRAA